MPVYVYKCNECGNGFEKMQPITADPLKECPTCGKSALRRVFQPVGVIFKGSGWYITDSRKSDAASVPAGDTDKGKDTAPAVAEKSDSKPEAKAETETKSTKTTTPEPKSTPAASAD